MSSLIHSRPAPGLILPEHVARLREKVKAEKAQDSRIARLKQELVPYLEIAKTRPLTAREKRRCRKALGRSSGREWREEGNQKLSPKHPARRKRESLLDAAAELAGVEIQKKPMKLVPDRTGQAIIEAAVSGKHAQELALWKKLGL